MGLWYLTKQIRLELFRLTALIEVVGFCEEQMCVASEKLNIPAENKEILVFLPCAAERRRQSSHCQIGSCNFPNLKKYHLSD